MNAARHEEELHAFLDEELSEEERTRVEQELTSAQDQADLQAFAQLGDLLREHAEEASAELPSEDLFAAIRDRVDEDVRLGRGYMRVVQGGGQRRLFTGAAVVLAVAAALALGFFVRGSQGVLPPSVASIGEHAHDAGELSSAIAVLEEPTLGSEVVEVDFGGNAGTVFAVEGAEGQPLAVVWIEDEKPTL
jgi:anti-sigma factor RsiW